jgi:hypothetical protein
MRDTFRKFILYKFYIWRIIDFVMKANNLKMKFNRFKLLFLTLFIIAKEIDILHADIQVSFDWSKHACYGTETILFKPYFYDIDSIVLNAQNMIFSKVEVKNVQGEIIQNLISYDKKKLKIRLEKNSSLLPLMMDSKSDRYRFYMYQTSFTN